MEEIKSFCYIDNFVVRFGFFFGGELDDFVGGWEELRYISLGIRGSVILRREN